MSFRSVLIGLLAGAALCAATYFNDLVIRQSYLVGSYIAFAVFGGLVVFVLLVNPLLQKIRRGWAFSGSELAVVVAISLAACYIPGRGLMHYFCTVLMSPHAMNQQRIPWQQHHVLALAPEQMLADPSANPDDALNRFYQGHAGQGHIGLGDIPWYAWRRTLAFWLPLLVTMSVAVVGLALVVHPQWSTHERLRYPIALFADALLPGPEGQRATVFRNAFFWLGAAAVLGIHAVNYAHAWWPRFIEIPVRFDFWPLLKLSDTFAAGGPWGLLDPRIYFMCVGFAYFLATDLSLSLGVAPFLYVWFTGLCAVHGVTLAGGFMQPSIEQFLYAGAWTGTCLVLLYTGRRYFWNTFKKALGLGGADHVKRYSVWGARVAALALAAFVAQLLVLGLDWPLAALYTVGVVVLYVAVARVVAEAGLYYLHPFFFPCATIVGFLGAEAVGAKGALILFMLSSLLLMDPRELLMPFVVQGLKIVELQRVPVGRVGALAVPMVLVGFAVAVPVTLYWSYDRGINTASDGWTTGVPGTSFDAVVAAEEHFEAVKGYPLGDRHTGWEKFAAIQPSRPHVTAFAATLVLVLAFTAARIRFPAWPLHPILFVTLASYQSRVLAFSFLVGFTVKAAVSHLGGVRLYERVKPFMIGLIAGDLLGAILPNVIGAAYYFTTGILPKPFSVLD
ncbi:MAG: hypothetical protein NTV86_14315 [Planctomycetota bacterium]|nr:hypothetical protein [Planctomycetota bacterium]